MTGSLTAWTKYLDLAYPTKPADWDAELARIDATLREPGRMKALQTMGSPSPTDAGAQLRNVRCPVLVSWAARPRLGRPAGRGQKILADLPPASASWPFSTAPGTTPTPRSPTRSSR